MQFEDRLAIPTPEGVTVELTLAGLGSRMLAAMVDLGLKAVLVLAALLVLQGAFGLDLAVEILVPLAGLVLLTYDIAFETLAAGRTPGKRLNGLRVVRVGGAPVDLPASAVRNIVRLIDGLPLAYVPTIVSVAVTRRNQRPGDLAADTLVVRERRAAERTGLARAPLVPADVPAWDVSAVTHDHLATVRAFLERRSSLDPAARARLAGDLAARLRPLVGGAGAVDPEAFLEQLALVAARRARPGWPAGRS